MDNTQQSGGSWLGFITTLILGITAKLTLSDMAFIATIFAGTTTGLHAIYKWIKNK